MKPLALLIKPASADCNLLCEYCFYLEKTKLYPGSRTHRMEDTVLEALLRGYLGTSQPVYSMIWQGGEPALMGYPFFEKVVTLQKRFAPAGARISNSIQTNATMISRGLAAHLARYRFLAGCSLDGPPQMHNLYRRSKEGRGTHHLVLQGIRRLNRHKVPVNILVLVSRANVRKPLTVYRYLRDKGFTHLQFVPCVEFDSRGEPLPFSIGPKQWGEFITRIFDEWFAQDRGTISVRLFESVLSKLVSGRAAECCFGSRCDTYVVVEHNGDIYPCDFFVKPEYKIGNVLETSWEEILDSPVFKHFAGLKKQWNTRCDSCDFQELCLGDCLKYRMLPGREPSGLSWLCSGWRHFYEHSLQRLRGLARDIAANRPPAE